MALAMRSPHPFRSLLPAVLLALLPWSGAAEDGFVDLFNGRDLSGWVNVNCAPETWSWRDGVVHCTGKPTGALRTEKVYENFILELEWRHLQVGGNAGVFIWASPIAAPGVPFLRAVEVQVLDHGYGKSDWFTTHGDVFPIHGSSMKPFGRHNGMRSFPSEERSKGSPEWNHYRVACSNGVIRLSVNGKEVSGGEDAVWRRGYLGLESEGSPVEFRNIRIKELPGRTATPAQSAPLAAGFRPLYTGVDLRGWKVAGGAEPRFKSADWKLVSVGGGHVDQTLWTEKPLANGELVVDCRVPKGAALGAPAAILRLRGSESAASSLPLAVAGGDFFKGTLWQRSLPVDAWVRLHLRLRGLSVAIRLNDELIAEATLPDGTPASGPLGLVNTGSEVEWGNFYWRDE